MSYPVAYAVTVIVRADSARKALDYTADALTATDEAADTERFLGVGRAVLSTDHDPNVGVTDWTLDDTGRFRREWHPTDETERRIV